MQATLQKVHKEADNISTFWFKPEKPLDHIAGQFIEMFLPHQHPDDRGIKRWFTISSSPTDSPLISITTKFADKKGSSFKSALRKLQIDDEVKISEPMGDFVLPKDPKIPLVFVAGGIGITPFHSIIKFLYDNNEKRSIQFIYSVHSKHEQVFKSLLAGYGLKNNTLVVQEHIKSNGQTRRLTAERIIELVGKIDNKLIYISGPEMMVETLTSELIKIGVPKAQLVGDYFPNYSEV